MAGKKEVAHARFGSHPAKTRVSSKEDLKSTNTTGDYT
jgi:hypothetical protein